ncbi:MFS transporter [Saccharophagus degradans]|uniref:Major facilitator superfamily MFS_1 n=1 Tax=Saccharophagus degradans (strain 2-40 / ATCC 43961 / DSM 17024) TaxID=203122 RepID=Q21PJ5_SACD2|nr:MFS transporter [Saccharophagus degradans]ABD79384.1 major facilitator superfamily MFS_1 [Saccharophagus degradans 2-40]
MNSSVDVIAPKWRTPQIFLLACVFVMSFTFATWQVLLNNFVIERANFTGVEIGVLQSLREVPGFLAFTAVFVLLILREHYFALLSLLTLCVGVALTGFFPTALGLYCTTVLMSIGFHYFETINKSLTLQWIDKAETPHFMGRALAIKAVGSLGAYAMIWLAMEWMGVDYVWMYLITGTIGFMVVLVLFAKFPDFNQGVVQTKKLLVRKRYWLYYALVMLSGARRQIFVVFAGFMMVEKFGYTVGQISSLFIINYIFNFFFAARIGKWIGVIGERNALVIEYVGLIFVFTGYAFVSNAQFAAALYVIDHLFFAFAIAISTYFQKIAQKEDIAATASVSFTINHIAAVVIPVLLGMVWIVSPAAVFFVGVGLAVGSLVLSLNIPARPDIGNEVRVGKVG